MVKMVVIIASGVVLGALGTFLSFKWAWDWFGDIWHQNTTSMMWIGLYSAFFVLNSVLVKFSPQWLPDVSTHWWHYLVSTLFFLAGTALCVFWAVNK